MITHVCDLIVVEEHNEMSKILNDYTGIGIDPFLISENLVLRFGLT